MILAGTDSYLYVKKFIFPFFFLVLFVYFWHFFLTNPKSIAKIDKYKTMLGILKSL